MGVKRAVVPAPELRPATAPWGLGLLSKPSARTRYMNEAGYVWRLATAPLRPPPDARLSLQLAPLSTLSTWTGSFNKDLTRLQARGGGKSCDSGGPVQPDDTDPKRGALCCTRNIAMTGAGSSALKGLFTLPILELEQAINHKDWTQLAGALTPKMARFENLENTTRGDAVPRRQERARTTWQRYLRRSARAQQRLNGELWLTPPFR